MKKLISSVILIALLLSSSLSVLAEEAQTQKTADNEYSASASVKSSYRNYFSKLNSELRGKDIVIPCDSNCKLYSGSEISSYNGKDTVVFSGDESGADFTFSIEEEANYHVEITIVPLNNSNFGNSSVAVKINGEYPFDEAKDINAFWRWKMQPLETDKKGNEILSSMDYIEEATAVSLADPSGRQNEPLLFNFPKGENTISIIANTGNFRLLSIRLFSTTGVEDYKEVHKKYQNEGAADSKGQEIILEAEDFAEASSTTLTPNYDKSDVDTSPNDPIKLLYNYIPHEKYCSTGQWLKWEFTPEETGYYKISMRVRQNAKSGFSVSRRLYINGELPFNECKEIKFDYNSDWYIREIGDKEAFDFYFEKGKKYTLTLEVTSGTLSQTTGRIDDLVYELNSLYRSVIMVVGNDPDTYRDYQLHKVIPNFNETIDGLYEELKSILDELEERNSGNSGSTLSSFHSLAERLKKIRKNSDSLSKTMSSFKSEIQALSSWNQDAKEQPLDIDYISIHSKDKKCKDNESSFIKQWIFTFKRIIASFAEDYGEVGNVYDEASSLKIWINTGRDQMNIIKKLVDNSFSSKFGINANVSLVTVDIRTAVLAGTAPDVSLFLSGDMPINLALRGAVENLSEYEGFEDVSKRFGKHSLKPFEYDGGYYALPLSETFNMMFVRTDVFEELGLKAPETWEEFYQVSTILQRNNLEVGVPANIGMFATLLFQNGGQFYNEQKNQTEFGSDAAIEAFTTWSGLFSRYGFPLAYDFYNRFTSGEMPLAITDYTQYLKVEAASPELSGRWEMYMIPGTVDGDGKINRSISISAATGSDTSPGLAQSVTSAVVFSGSKHKKEAWEFLKWFTSDETQGLYGREIEDALGSISRYTSANVNAFKSVPWTNIQRALLEEQRNNIVALNEISGNYSVTRELINAFRKVVYNNANPTDTIYTYNKRINKELARKTKNS